jgi:hypothetical protein
VLLIAPLTHQGYVFMWLCRPKPKTQKLGSWNPVGGADLLYKWRGLGLLIVSGIVTPSKNTPSQDRTGDLQRVRLTS